MKWNIRKMIDYAFLFIGIYMVASLFLPFLISWLFEYVDFNELLFFYSGDYVWALAILPIAVLFGIEHKFKNLISYVNNFALSILFTLPAWILSTILLIFVYDKFEYSFQLLGICIIGFFYLFTGAKGLKLIKWEVLNLY
jgi:hypothetical protein